MKEAINEKAQGFEKEVGGESAYIGTYSVEGKDNFHGSFSSHFIRQEKQNNAHAKT